MLQLKCIFTIYAQSILDRFPLYLILICVLNGKFAYTRLERVTKRSIDIRYFVVRVFYRDQLRNRKSRYYFVKINKIKFNGNPDLWGRIRRVGA